MITLEQLSAHLDTLSSQLNKALLEDLTQAAIYTQGQLTETVMERLNKGPKGTLARSWKITYGTHAGGLAAWILSDLVYAGVQDTGGTIYPRRGKYLAIPLTTAAKYHSSPRDFGGDLFVRKARSGKLFLAMVSGRGKSASIEHHYMLVTSVHINPTFYTREAAEASQPEVARLLGKNAVVHIERGLDGKSL